MTTPSDTATAHRPPPGWRAAAQRLRHTRASRGQAVVAALCGLLAFALVTQVHSNATATGLGTARQDDLIGILNDLTARSDRIRQEIATLEATEQRLASSTDQSQAALDEARKRAQALGILAGTVPATGPGITLTIDDPRGAVHSDVLVDALQELRDAGAEAMQLGPVRVVASTYVTDSDAGVSVDGTELRAPYTFRVIGDPRTLAAALAIPGGVIDTVERQEGASATVAQQKAVSVSALRAP
jgi:uncharacterized protein YlxW (UPF0749 family)